ncbi:alpha/beta fold hydrolase [Pimelobacter sp. 30-1]|uniref:alpha/beta fold hydrolase n=1 Tax=Pimelobacter sp. 30-1 TaxID=2004991 RepID=UPI001C04B233|nr:alpha/beta hydrolase [Pimelobacter sp. 30-1]
MSALLPEPRYVDTNGVRLAVHEARPTGRARDVCVVLCHGFPELALSWRHQMQPLADAGFHVLAPDLRGYGGSTGPAEPTSYSIRETTADVAGLVAEAGYERAVVVGHDFGGMVSWWMPHLHPERVAGVVTLNTPFGYSRDHPLEANLAAFGPDNYIAHFQTPELQALLEKDPARTFRFFFRRDTGAGTTLSATGRHDADAMAYSHRLADDEDTWPGEVLLDDAELAAYAEVFGRTGFGGPLGWYRSIEETWRVQNELYPDGVIPRLTVPALMIAARRDPICHPDRTDDLLLRVEDLERRMVDTGHWTQQEDPEGVTAILLAWLDRHF